MLASISPSASVQADCLGGRFQLIQLVLIGHNIRVDSPVSMTDPMSNPGAAPEGSLSTTSAASTVPKGEPLALYRLSVELNNYRPVLAAKHGPPPFCTVREDTSKRFSCCCT